MIQLKKYTDLDVLISPTKNIFIPFYFISNKGTFEYKIQYLGNAKYIFLVNNEKPKLIKTKSKLLSYIKDHLYKHNFKEKMLEEISLDLEAGPSLLDEITDNMTEEEITSLSKKMVESLNIIKFCFQDCVEITKSYIKHYGTNLKYHIGDMLEAYIVKSGAAAALMGGERARHAAIHQLANAKKMSKNKESVKDIWMRTGWEQGTDLKWRFEMEDYTAKIKTVPLASVNCLGDVLDFPQLFDNYPDLKKVPVRYLKDFGKNSSFSHYNDKPSISLNRGTTISTTMHDMEFRDYVRKEKDSSTGKRKDLDKEILEYVREMDKDQWYVMRRKSYYDQNSEIGDMLTLPTGPSTDSAGAPNWMSIDHKPDEPVKIPSWLNTDYMRIKDSKPIWISCTASNAPIRNSKIEREGPKGKSIDDIMIKHKALWKQLMCPFIKSEDELYNLITYGAAIGEIPNPIKEDEFENCLKGLVAQFKSESCVRDKDGNRISITEGNYKLLDAMGYLKLRNYRQIGFKTYLGPNGTIKDDEGKNFVWHFTNVTSLATVLHETQHLIQWYEGFASGGNSTRIEDNYLRKKETRYTKEYLEKLCKEDGSTITIDVENISDIKKEIYKKEKERARKIGLSVYRGLAGEVEARNVEKRNKLFPNVTGITPPSETEDTKRDKQYVVFEIEDIDKIDLNNIEL